LKESDPFFDESSTPVAAVDFPFDELDRRVERTQDASDSVLESRLDFDRRHATAALLELLTTNATPREAGQRAFLLAHRLKLSGCKTKRELADRMGLTEGRVSQITKVFDAHLSRINIH
jgi:hypothetical protein